jgi:hypothetical protein
MPGFLIAAFFIAAVIFFAPFILSVALFLIITAFVMALLVKLGFLTGVYTKRYRYVRGRKRPGRGDGRLRPEEEGGADAESSDIRYDTFQEGEEITLPETALHKGIDSKKEKTDKKG